MAAKLVPLDRIDPAEAWRPWQPTSADTWGRKWAAHLYRRAAFGASREELLEAERLGPQKTLDHLLQGSPNAAEAIDDLLDVGRIAAGRDDSGDQLRGWWLYCILHGGHPLREKMVLFWHNHFATSIAKVQHPGLMFMQNTLLRRHALGKFPTLLQEISKDPAMLIWLDSNSNVKGRPNENYAREVMELFSLGVGNYTEKDIREAARAFTGWHTDGRGFAFDAAAHDDGTKTVLGQTGNLNGDDVVRVILRQPAAARFLVRKLYAFLISETATPPDTLLEPLCHSFRASDYDITALLRTMLSSRHFYSDHAFRQRIKGPVEYVLGAVQAVYRRCSEGDADYRPLPQQVLVPRLEAMGQALFAPPNVKGWVGGRSWLNTATLLERANFAGALATGTLWTTPFERPTTVAALAPSSLLANGGNPAPQPASADGPEGPVPPRAFDPARLVHEEGASSAEGIVRVLIDLYLPGGIPAGPREKLVAFIGEGRPSGAELERRVREAVHAILTMAEQQLA
jgi:uncharacterized protein (DUF1800 family)